ncbi:hypothetical protein [Bradyrhizobium sp. NP1]|uniref:hypothetical protein n=1 Tax=Bradyrhizobium sp. NP1 TaxID=3049772 RepID=UPI0025A68936|nr:hypothetical protein [Bradyrhizobium sp. NP1]WJR78447.1 hypothetical protein QOU61_01100 [Bradyrhizobium sp. NP1]
MKKNRVIEREDRACLERLNDFNRQLHLLRSLKTATKKRRALKRAARSSVLTQSSASTSVDGALFDKTENTRKRASASGHQPLKL